MVFDALKASAAAQAGETPVRVADAVVCAVLYRMEFLVLDGYPKKALRLADSFSQLLIDPRAPDPDPMFKGSTRRELHT